MAKFITGSELEKAVYDIIWDAEEILMIVSPFVKLVSTFSATSSTLSSFNFKQHFRCSFLHTIFIPDILFANMLPYNSGTIWDIMLVLRHKHSTVILLTEPRVELLMLKITNGTVLCCVLIRDVTIYKRSIRANKV